jgi:hypothetical protein
LERSDKDYELRASPLHQELNTVSIGKKLWRVWSEATGIKGEPNHAASPLYQELDTVSMSEALRRFWSTATGIKE